MPKPK
jgi:PhoH-like ATPase